MPLLYWLQLIGFVISVSFLGVLRNFLASPPHVDVSCHDLLSSPAPHPFLCGQRIRLNHARVGDISSIDGISQKKAREIYQFIKGHPHASLNDLREVKGIGPKTLERLRERFL